MRLHQARLALCAVLALFFTHCQSCEEPDPNGSPPGNLLPFDRWVGDQLHCARRDCQDWYFLRVPARGTVRVQAQSSNPDTALRSFILRLTDERVRILDDASSRGEAQMSVEKRLDAGTYYVGILTADQVDTPLRYQVIAHYEEWRPPPPPIAPQPTPRPRPPAPPPPPPPPQFQTLRSEVLEVDRTPGDHPSVLLSHGSTSGVQKGQRGRLKEGSSLTANIEIIEVYPDGSRARLLDAPQQPITPSTQAEIDIPR